MAEQLLTFRCLIISPSDVEAERQATCDAIDRWNAHAGRTVGSRVEHVRWETHSAPEMGGHPQSILDRQIVDDCDMAIALFWTRAGTATMEHPSGSAEEIARLRAKGARVLVYFCERPMPSDVDLAQVARVRELRRGYELDGLISTFDTADRLRELVVAHLSEVVRRVVERVAPPSGQQLSPRDDELLTLLADVQGRSISLGACAARALALARRYRHDPLRVFCERELSGYEGRHFEQNDPETPTYRIIEVFASISAEINMQFYGWGQSTSSIFEYMKRSEDFFPHSLLLPWPIARLETEAPPSTKAILHIRSKWRQLDPSTKHPDVALNIYAPGDSNPRVLEAIRMELTRRLLALLPQAPTQVGGASQ